MEWVDAKNCRERGGGSPCVDGPLWSQFGTLWRSVWILRSSLVTGRDRRWPVGTDVGWFELCLEQRWGQLFGNMCALYCASLSKIISYVAVSFRSKSCQWNGSQRSMFSVFERSLSKLRKLMIEFCPSNLHFHFQSVPERRQWKRLLKRNAWPCGFALPSTNTRTWAAGITMCYPMAWRGLGSCLRMLKTFAPNSKCTRLLQTCCLKSWERFGSSQQIWREVELAWSHSK